MRSWRGWSWDDGNFGGSGLEPLKQVFSGKPQVQSYANILAVNDDGSLTAEFEKEPWPAVVLEGEVQPGDRVGVTAVSNGVLWCTKA